MGTEDIKEFTLALVTGATSGIGEELCKLLASKGISLIITGRNLEKLNQLSSELSSQVKVASVSADLETIEGRKKVLALIHAQKPDLVINNAGFGLYGDSLSYETSELMKVLEVNCAVVLEFSLEAARTLISDKKRGVIVNIASAAAFIISPTLCVYSATKAFVNQFSEAFDMEVKPQGVRVLSACPGVVNTNFRQRAGGEVSSPMINFEMSAPFAAEEIWRQIQKGKPSYVFHWPYRISIFLSRYIIPKKWAAKAIKNSVTSFTKPRPFIPIKK